MDPPGASGNVLHTDPGTSLVAPEQVVQDLCLPVRRAGAHVEDLALLDSEPPLPEEDATGQQQYGGYRQYYGQ